MSAKRLTKLQLRALRLLAELHAFCRRDLTRYCVHHGAGISSPQTGATPDWSRVASASVWQAIDRLRASNAELAAALSSIHGEVVALASRIREAQNEGADPLAIQLDISATLNRLEILTRDKGEPA